MPRIQKAVQVTRKPSKRAGSQVDVEIIGPVGSRNLSRDYPKMRKHFAATVEITVPLVPPTVNSYVRHTRKGRHYVSAEAIAFKKAVGLCARGQKIRAEEYGVEIYIMLGAKKKGDLDNFAKCCLDGLVESGVIDSDAKITTLALHKKRDHANPRTEITIWER